jgi:hypothetical protein
MADAKFPAFGDSASLPAFDAAKFQALTIDDPELQQHLITSFLAESEGMCTELLQSAQEGGLWFADALHRLKGTAHFVAASRLADALEKFECMDLQSDPSVRQAAVRHIQLEVGELTRALRQERTHTGGEPVAPGA